MWRLEIDIVHLLLHFVLFYEPAPHQYSKTASVSPELLAFCVDAGSKLGSSCFLSKLFFFSVLY